MQGTSLYPRGVFPTGGADTTGGEDVGVSMVWMIAVVRGFSFVGCQFFGDLRFFGAIPTCGSEEVLIPEEVRPHGRSFWGTR